MRDLSHDDSSTDWQVHHLQQHPSLLYSQLQGNVPMFSLHQHADIFKQLQSWPAFPLPVPVQIFPTPKPLHSQCSLFYPPIP
jgi:hypothetical protein